MNLYYGYYSDENPDTGSQQYNPNRDFKPMPMKYRCLIFIVAIINSIITYLYEKVIVWYITIWWKAKSDRVKEAHE